LSEGFLGTQAPRLASVGLLIEIVMGVLLLIGATLARMQRYRLHARCQSLVVILNIALIALIMIPSFRDQVLPKIPAKLGRPYYSLATAHAMFGSVAQAGGLYVLLSAGTQLLPQRVRIANFKLWMRSVLLLWWCAILLGLATYTRWHLPNLFRR
jgi:hypothetical protein